MRNFQERGFMVAVFIAALLVCCLSGCETLSSMQRDTSWNAIFVRATAEQMLADKRMSVDDAARIAATTNALEGESHAAFKAKSRKRMHAVRAGMRAQRFYVTTREKTK